MAERSGAEWERRVRIIEERVSDFQFNRLQTMESTPERHAWLEDEVKIQGEFLRQELMKELIAEWEKRDKKQESGDHKITK